MPALTGLAALGTEAGLWMYEHRNLQSAADSAALTAAIAHYREGAAANLPLNAGSVLSSYGLADGQGGTSLTVNHPPQTGTQTGNSNAVEVNISQTRSRLLSAVLSSQPLVLSARAVAVGNGGKGCVLALNPNAGGSETIQGSAQVVLNGCSLLNNSTSASALSVGGSGTVTAQSVSVVGGVSGASSITTTGGIATGQLPSADPYAGMSFPSFSGCAQRNFSSKTTETIDPGVYCGGMQLNAGANVTLNPGIYTIDGGGLTVNGGAVMSGVGVTIVFTSSSGHNYPDAKINGGAIINLSAPTSGPTAGLVIFGDRLMTVGTAFKFEGGATQILQGAIYVPAGAVSFAGGANATAGCTQLIADTITFTGNSIFLLNCTGLGTKSIASALASLVE